MWASGKGFLKELEALADLCGGVDVERSAVSFGEGAQVGSIAVESAVAVVKRTRIYFGWGDLIGQDLEPI